MKWRLLIISILVLSTTLCANASDPIVVEMWFGEFATDYIEAMNKIIESFEELHPGIKVDITKSAIKDDSALIAAVIGGVPPDIVYTDGHRIQQLYLTEGIMHPVSDYVSPEELSGLQWIPGIKQTFYYDGKWYGLPFRTAAYGLYSNQDLLAQAGFSTQSGPVTIDELDAWAKKMSVQNADGTYKRVGFMPRGNNWLDELGWLQVFGGELFNAEANTVNFAGKPQHLEALNWIRDYALRYGWNALTPTQANFLAGKVAFRVDSTTSLTNYPSIAPDFNFWVSPVPRRDGNVHVSYAPSLGTAIPIGAKNPKAAAQFMLYLCKPEVQAFWYNQVRSVPTNMKALELIARDVKDPRELSLVKVLSEGSFGPPPLLSVMRQYFKDFTLQMMKGDLSPEGVLEKMDTALKPEYKSLFRK